MPQNKKCVHQLRRSNSNTARYAHSVGGPWTGATRHLPPLPRSYRASLCAFACLALRNFREPIAAPSPIAASRHDGNLVVDSFYDMELFHGVSNEVTVSPPCPGTIFSSFRRRWLVAHLHPGGTAVCGSILRRRRYRGVDAHRGMRNGTRVHLLATDPRIFDNGWQTPAVETQQRMNVVSHGVASVLSRTVG